MQNKVFLSMGALVERRNFFDEGEVVRTVPLLMSEGFIDGAEFMFIRTYYEHGVALAETLLSEGCVFPTFHTDKDIGKVLSDGGVAKSKGCIPEAEKLRENALDMFKYNCETACAAKSERLVLHLWGGENSDRAIDFNCDALGDLVEISDSYGLKLLIENVPSVVTDPLTNWLKIKDHFGKIGLVFDTRFATCHRNAKETLESEAFPYIEHVHVSDYRGGLKEFSCLRPVFHPGEGICDYSLIFGKLKDADYKGSFTLESPGIIGDGPEINLDNLKLSLSFIRNSIRRA